jgi:hypothetical protein
MARWGAVLILSVPGAYDAAATGSPAAVAQATDALTVALTGPESDYRVATELGYHLASRAAYFEAMGASRQVAGHVAWAKDLGSAMLTCGDSEHIVMLERLAKVSGTGENRELLRKAKAARKRGVTLPKSLENKVAELRRKGETVRALRLEIVWMALSHRDKGTARRRSGPKSAAR